MSDVSTYYIQTGRKFYDTQQFAKSLSEFGTIFNQHLMKFGLTNGDGSEGNVFHGGVDDDSERFTSVNGVRNYTDSDGDLQPTFDFVKFFLNCDGNLIIKGDPFFWNNYMIRFTNLGAAILGIDDTSLTNRVLTFTGDSQNAVFVNVINNQIIAGDNTIHAESMSTYSIFQSAECRIKCSVESHLPVQSTVEVRDEVETINHEIGSAFFLNDVRVHTQWGDDGTLQMYTLQSTMFSGQMPLIHQNSKVKQWNRLTTAYNIQFFRFFLNIHYRVFDETSSKWGVKIERMKIDDTDFWAMKLRFVSDE